MFVQDTLTTSFTAAASVIFSVEFTQLGDRIAYSEDFTVAHLRSGQSRLEAHPVEVSMKFPCPVDEPHLRTRRCSLMSQCDA
jgi:hypothetical protein